MPKAYLRWVPEFHFLYFSSADSDFYFRHRLVGAAAPFRALWDLNSTACTLYEYQTTPEWSPYV